MSFYKSGLVVVGAGLAGALFGYWLCKRTGTETVVSDWLCKRTGTETVVSDWLCKRTGTETVVVPGADLLMDVLFFPDSDVVGVQEMEKQQREQICRQILCSSRSLQKIMEYISSAEHSLDICMYHLTSHDLGSAVLDTINRGVKVRLICDYDSEAASGSQVGRFRQSGAFVRTKRQQYIMHHKFAIIDQQKLVTGSFNWTMTAAMGNRENVLVTNHQETVSKFSQEFDRLWIEYTS